MKLLKGKKYKAAFQEEIPAHSVHGYTAGIAASSLVFRSALKRELFVRNI
jgi:hypothetical protein